MAIVLFVCGLILLGITFTLGYLIGQKGQSSRRVTDGQIDRAARISYQLLGPDVGTSQYQELAELLLFGGADFPNRLQRYSVPDRAPETTPPSINLDGGVVTNIGAVPRYDDALVRANLRRAETFRQERAARPSAWQRLTRSDRLGHRDRTCGRGLWFGLAQCDGEHPIRELCRDLLFVGFRG